MVATALVEQFLQVAAHHHVAVHAYCLMPDHLHGVCEVTSSDGSFVTFVSAFKQRSGFAFARQAGQRLWQESFFERHLRADEDMARVARYVLENPVRAGLAVRPQDYPYSGSGTMGLDDVLSSLG